MAFHNPELILVIKCSYCFHQLMFDITKIVSRPTDSILLPQLRLSDIVQLAGGCIAEPKQKLVCISFQALYYTHSAAEEALLSEKRFGCIFHDCMQFGKHSLESSIADSNNQDHRNKLAFTLAVLLQLFEQTSRLIY